MKDVKLKDIAQMAGVSPTTVTRVFRNNGYVSQEKRQLVEQAMAKANFSPSRAQASKGFPPQALLFTNGVSNNPLFDKITRNLGLEFQKYNWQLLCHYISSESIEADTYIQVIEQNRKQNLGGVIFNCLGDVGDFTSIRRYLTSLPFPVVMIERSPDIYGISKIQLNSEETLFSVVRYLARIGHSHLLFVCVDNDKEVEQMRLRGYRFGINTMGIEMDSDILRVERYDTCCAAPAIEAYLESHPLPTAIIAADQLVIGILDYLNQKGYQVPRDVSIVGLDDTHSLFTLPTLTSIAFPIIEIAQHTVRILREAQDHETLPQNIRLSTKLIERNSVSIPRSRI